MSVKKRDNLGWMFGKVSSAVGVLVRHPGDVRERVWVAATHLMQVNPAGLPAALRADVEWIHHMLTRHPADGHLSALRATYRRTRSVTASKIAARVWALYHLMETELQRRGQ